MIADTGNVFAALAMTAAAGLSTGLGSLSVFFSRRTDKRFLSVSLGFSAGVMIYISFVEILFKGRTALVEALGIREGAWAAAAGFFGGILLIALIDGLIPESRNPHERSPLAGLFGRSPGGRPLERLGGEAEARLLRTGLLTALAVTIHNFPEGLATFFIALKDPAMGIPVMVAVALHNIPEGIAVATPVFLACGSRIKAATWAFLSGMAEPVGAMAGFLLLRPFMNEAVLGVLFAAVAGIMVFISLDQLLPTAEKFGKHHLAVYGLVGGMGVMALSLILLG